MKKLLLLIAVLGISFTANAQVTVSDVRVPGDLTIEGENLLLNGAGLREKFFIDLYVGALYTNNKSASAKDIIKADKPSAITLDIVSKLVSQDNMIESVEEGFQNSTSRKERKAIQGRIDKFIGMFSEKIVNGDQFVLYYVPGSGVNVYKNGEKLGVIEGMDFKEALWGIWLGKYPADDDLKAAMLGK